MSKATAQTSEPLSGNHAVAVAVSLVRQHAGHRRPLPRLSAAARLVICRHEWREDHDALDACIQHALVLCEGEVIEVQHLDLTDEYAGSERARDTILSVLNEFDGARSAAAAELGISPRTLRHQLADLRAAGVPVPAARSARPELGRD